MTLTSLRQNLRSAARPGGADDARRYFKTGTGEYGEGDIFLGVRMADIRALVATTDDLAESAVTALLGSAIHEERLLAVLILVRRFERGNRSVREQIFRRYLRDAHQINNWDLVDASAPNIVGVWMREHPADQPLLDQLAVDPNLWKRRIAIVSTFTLIRHRQLDPTFRIARILHHDPEDLIHKAVGWMLRETGKKNDEALREYLRQYAPTMPRTMLRYAIEKFPPKERARWRSLRPNEEE